MIKEVKAVAPAKINLGLEILKKRSDGYHEVDMIMQSINLFDEIIIEKSCDKKINVIHEKPIGCSEKKDISYRCAALFFKYLKKENEGIKIKIKKKIPLGAGLAGGSSDGAAVLLALNYMYGNFLTLNDLIKIGASVGSDIPFCILGGTARAQGIGTILQPFNSNLDYTLVIVKPDIFVSTSMAYARASIVDSKEIRNLDFLEQAIKKSDFNNFSLNLFNRFEDFIFKQLVNDLKYNLQKLGAHAALMTGSGPTVYGIFKSEDLASICFKNLKIKYNDVFICKPIKIGAKVVL